MSRAFPQTAGWRARCPLASAPTQQPVEAQGVFTCSNRARPRRGSPRHSVCIIMLITTKPVTMRQPQFRKRLEEEHIAKQILTKQIVSLLLGDWPPLFASLREKTVRACVCVDFSRFCRDTKRRTCKLSLSIYGVTSVLANDLVIANSPGGRAHCRFENREAMCECLFAKPGSRPRRETPRQ